VKEVGYSLEKKLVTEAPVNGGRNYENCCSYKIWLYAGIPYDVLMPNTNTAKIK